MGRNRHRSCFAGYVLAAIVIAACAAPFARSNNLQMVRLICLPGTPLAVVVGQMRGIFAKYDITVQATKAKDAVSLRATLASGDAEIAHSSVENAVAMIDSSQADAVIVVGGEGSTSELIVQPDITSVKDLRGRTIITDGTDTAYTLILKKILLLNGVRAGTDCEFKVMGLAPQRLDAMKENKEYSATIQKPPTSILSQRAGLKSLGSTQSLLGVGPSQGIGGFVQRRWASEHSDVLQRYLAAFVESQRWLMAPENKTQVVELLMKESHLPADIASDTYDADIKGGWTPDARFQADGFKQVLDLQSGGNNASKTPERAADQYYDLSYYEKALSILNNSVR